MQQLVKIQYSNFEPGEYTDEKERSAEETIQLIAGFPWEKQRDHLRVGLTSPSVTIQDARGNFLKLALYYNGKFILYFFSPQHQLFSKSFSQYAEATPLIRSFFDDHPFDTTDFTLQHSWPDKNLSQFTDRDFQYRVTDKRIWRFLLGSSGISFAASLIMLGFVIGKLFTYSPGKHPLALLLAIPFIALLGGGLNLILFANYYRHSKRKLLIISKGDDFFYYGPEESPERFDKKEILQVTEYKNRGTRNPIAFFAWVEIQFNDGRRLAIPNLLIDEKELEHKFPGVITQAAYVSWPSISPGDEALS